MPTARSQQPKSTEAAIFGRVFAGGSHPMTPDIARHVLALGFSEEDVRRMHDLAARNQEGALSPGEVQELDNYVRVGDLLAILQSKARKFLKANPD